MTIAMLLAYLQEAVRVGAATPESEVLIVHYYRKGEGSTWWQAIEKAEAWDADESRGPVLLTPGKAVMV